MFKKLFQRFIPGGGSTMKLKVGDEAPEFECLNHKGELIRSKDLVGQRYLLWFYPMADTPG